MFCEYLVVVRMKLSEKPFKEECKINLTEKEWRVAVEPESARQFLKVIKFSEDFKKFESFQMLIPLDISARDKAEVYHLIESDKFWQKSTQDNFLQRVKAILNQY